MDLTHSLNKDTLCHVRQKFFKVIIWSLINIYVATSNWNMNFLLASLTFLCPVLKMAEQWHSVYNPLLLDGSFCLSRSPNLVSAPKHYLWPTMVRDFCFALFVCSFVLTGRWAGPRSYLSVGSSPFSKL